MASEVNADSCEARKQLVDERFARDMKDIDVLKDEQVRQDEKTNKLSDLSIQMGEIIKRYEGTLQNHEQRIIAFEAKAGKRWETVVDVALRWIVAAVLAAVIVIKYK